MSASIFFIQWRNAWAASFAFWGFWGLFGTMAFAQPAWEQGLQQLEKRHAADMLALNQKILQELEIQLKRTTQAGDLTKANALDAKRKDLLIEIEQLKKVGSPGTPSSEDVQARRVVKDADGKLWKLENTQNIKAIVVEPGGVRAATLDGEAYGSAVASSQMLPHLFYGMRNDGNGQAYLFSPDLQKLMSLTVSGAIEGKLLPKKP